MCRHIHTGFTFTFFVLDIASDWLNWVFTIRTSDDAENPFKWAYLCSLILSSIILIVYIIYEIRRWLSMTSENGETMRSTSVDAGVSTIILEDIPILFMNLYYIYVIDRSVADDMWHSISSFLCCFCMGMKLTDLINDRKRNKTGEEWREPNVEMQENASMFSTGDESKHHVGVTHSPTMFAEGDFVEVLENFYSDSMESTLLSEGHILMVKVVEDGDIRVNTLKDDWRSNHWIFEANHQKIRLVRSNDPKFPSKIVERNMFTGDRFERLEIAKAIASMSTTDYKAFVAMYQAEQNRGPRRANSSASLYGWMIEDSPAPGTVAGAGAKDGSDL